MTFPTSSNFGIALTFSNTLQDVQATNLSKPSSPMSVVEKWGSSNQQGDAEDNCGGIICGGMDGALYVFCPQPSHSTSSGDSSRVAFPVIASPPTLSSASSRSSSAQRITRPNSSNSYTNPRSPKFAMSARPRVVSGLTTEAVEAPRNYVDFEDEPDKLKDILKGRAPREKHHLSETSSSTEKSNKLSVTMVPSDKRRSLSRSLLSTAKATQSSLPASPRSTGSSIPDSKPLQPADVLQPWTILCQSIPSIPSLSSCVTSIQFLDDTYAAVLVEAG